MASITTTVMLVVAVLVRLPLPIDVGLSKCVHANDTDDSTNQRHAENCAERTATVQRLTCTIHCRLHR
jgi:hypothetical protein